MEVSEDVPDGWSVIKDWSTTASEVCKFNKKELLFYVTNSVKLRMGLVGFMRLTFFIPVGIPNNGPTVHCTFCGLYIPSILSLNCFLLQFTCDERAGLDLSPETIL